MVIIKFDFVFLLIFIHVAHSERRIVGGEQVTSEKSYVVYLVKAKMSDKHYDSWLCGGALVSKDFIITSAACVEDVHFMYAIAGYNKYIPDKNLDEDDCTRQMRKKIVYTCVPVSYEFDFDQIEKWAYIDIAMVKVESPYEFNNPDYEIMCSYAPTTIPINYDVKRQAENVDAMVLGWGHTELWRTHGDQKNYNQEYLRFSATSLYDKNKCKEAYKDYPDLLSTIDKYMVCSLEAGHLNDHGVPYSMNQKNRNGMRTGCITQKQKSLGLQGVLCEDEIVENTKQANIGDARKHLSLKKKTNNVTNKSNGKLFVNGTNILNRTYTVNGTDNIYKPGFGKIRDYFNKHFARRNGICQNDHGGPLVTWVGKTEVLIGVASVFKITEDKKCIGPFLYTSTLCNGAFIGCVLGDKRANALRGHNESVSTRKALLCDSSPSVKGFDTIESYVSWKDHPDGPADNEMHGDGKQGQNKKNDRYAEVVREDSGIDSSDDGEEPKDRFSQKIGPPLKRRPRITKKPPDQQKPPNQQRNGPPPKWDPQQLKRSPGMESPALMETEMKSPRIIWPSPETEPPPMYRPPPEMKPPPVFRLPQETNPSSIYRPPQEMELPPIDRPPQEMELSPIDRPPQEIELPPIDRPPPEIKLPPNYRPPPEMKAPPMYRFPQEMKPPPMYRPPQETNPLSIYRPPHELELPSIDRPSQEMELPPIDRPPQEIELPPIDRPTPEILPPMYRPPQEMKPQPIYRPPSEMDPPPLLRPPPDIEPLPEMAPPPLFTPPPEIKRPEQNTPPIIPPSKMENPEFSETFDFQSDDRLFEEKEARNSYLRAQPEIQLRIQRPINS